MAHHTQLSDVTSGSSITTSSNCCLLLPLPMVLDVQTADLSNCSGNNSRGMCSGTLMGCCNFLGLSLYAADPKMLCTFLMLLRWKAPRLRDKHHLQQSGQDVDKQL